MPYFHDGVRVSEVELVPADAEPASPSAVKKMRHQGEDSAEESERGHID